MASPILWVTFLGLVALTARYAVGLHRNIQLAKRIGLPYVITPWYTVTVPWFVLAPIVNPVLKCWLPSILTRSWLKFMDPFWTWHLLYSPFHEKQSDTILTVSATGIAFNTCSPEIITQLGAQRKDFKKPLEIYKVVETFGPHIATVEGRHWIQQRRAMQPSFSEASEELAWNETIYQMKELLKNWERDSEFLGKREYLNFQDDLKMLALHVVITGSFGIRMFWPDNETKSPGESHVHSKSNQRFSLREALLVVAGNPMWIFILPLNLLKWAPSKLLNSSRQGYLEIGRHMKEYIEKRRNRDDDQMNKKHGTYLLDSLISSTQKARPSKAPQFSLTDQEIISNVFNSLTAGHDSVGAALFYTLINLAIYPSWQVQVQAELDEIFSNRDPTTWSYTEDSNELLHSRLDAAIMETLRLFPPINMVPKQSSPDNTSILRYKGKEIEVPPDTKVLVLIASTHRNHHYWPPPDLGTCPFDADIKLDEREDVHKFRPERWFVSKNVAEAYRGSIIPVKHSKEGAPADEELLEDTQGFFAPCKGAFIPWSFGERHCIGKSFAHVELMVAIAVMLKEWSIELVVDQGDEHDAGGKGKENWESVRDRAEESLRVGMKHWTAMQLGHGLIPLKIVRRECESPKN